MDVIEEIRTLLYILMRMILWIVNEAESLVFKAFCVVGAVSLLMSGSHLPLRLVQDREDILGYDILIEFLPSVSVHYPKSDFLVETARGNHKRPVISRLTNRIRENLGPVHVTRVNQLGVFEPFPTLHGSIVGHNMA